MFFHRLMICCSEFTKFIKVIFQVLYGSWKLSSLSQPRITIFGGSRVGKESKYAKDTFDLAQRLVNQDISVLTGGGSGVMNAANCGAVSSKKKDVKSVGIGVKELGEGRNPCVQEYFELEYFFARKWLLTRYSMAFIVFPGGFGTMDELAEVLTLIQTKKLDRVPIVMVGKEYWRDFMEWAKDSAVAHGLIDQEDLKLFTITDDLDEVFEIISKECDRIKLQMKK